ncbi:MAG: FKBP-type peptidyl-prolyl cis-trans isomerase [bacterium]
MNQAKIFIVAVGVLIALSVVSGGLLYSKVWNPAWNPFQSNAKELVQKALIKTWGLKALKINSNFEFTQKDFNLKATITHDNNKTDPQKIKFNSAFDINTSVKGKEYPIAGEVKKIGEEGYLKITRIPSFIEEEKVLSYVGINIDKVKNKWVGLSKDSFSSAFGGMLGEDMDATDTSEFNAELDNNIAKSKESYEKVAQFIKSGSFFTIKNKLADENINGQKTYHYILALNAPEVKKFILDFNIEHSTSSISSILSPLALLSSFPSATGRAKESRIISAMSQMRTVAVYIDSDTGSYKDFSCSTQDAVVLCKEIEKHAGVMPIIFTNRESYCSFSPLTVEGYYYCTDSTGKANISKNPQIAGYCDGKTFICPPTAEISQQDREEAGKKEFSKSLDDFFGQVGEITADVWIGQKDEFVYRFKFNKELNFKNYSEASTTMNVMADINLSDFDRPLDIQAPTEFQTIADILAPMPPKIIYPANNSKIHTIAPAILLDNSSSSMFFTGIAFMGIWEGEKKIIGKDEKDFLTWGTVSPYEKTMMGGPVGKMQWNNYYTFAVKSCRDKALRICSDWSEPVYAKLSSGTGLFTESDSGKNYFIKGTVVYTKESSGIMVNGKTVKDMPGMEDKCLYDFTGKEEDRGILMEYYKTGNLKNPVGMEQYKCPQACENGVCIKPYINAISPTEGQKFNIGNSTTILWVAKAIEKVNIFLIGYNQASLPMSFEGSSDGYSIATNIDSKSRYNGPSTYGVSWNDPDEHFFEWNIPDNIDYLTKYPCYKIKIETPDKKVSASNQACLNIIKALKIETLKQGSGITASRGDKLSVYYTGKLASNGTVFDLNEQGKPPFEFTLGGSQVISGWNQGIYGMKAGERRKLTIPPELAYGVQGSGPGGLIPPNATLIFEIELLKIN